MHFVKVLSCDNLVVNVKFFGLKFVYYKKHAVCNFCLADFVINFGWFSNDLVGMSWQRWQNMPYLIKTQVFQLVDT